MAFNSGSGSTVVTGDISTVSSIPVPTTNQDVINIIATANGSYNTVYTVPAGKIFYLMGGCYPPAANGYLSVTKTDGSTQVVMVKVLANDNGFFQGICPIWGYAATEDVIAKGSQAVAYNLWGVLVDV